MSDADGGVVSTKKGSKSAVDQCLRFCIKSRGRFIQDQNVGILDESASDGNALLLPTGELSSAGSNLSVESIRLETC